MRKATGARTQMKVSAIDASYAHDPVWVLIGPTEVADSSEYLNSLRAIAAVGVQNRLGLIPSPSTVWWDVNPALSGDMVWEGLRVDESELNSLLTELVTKRPGEPIYASHRDGYLQLRMDHGLGDALFMCEIVAALTREQDPSSPGFVEPVLVPNLAKPLTALAKSIVRGHGALTVVGDFLREIRRRAHRTPARHQPAERRGEPAHYSVAFARSSPDFLSELRGFRDTHHPGVSTSAMLFFVFRRAARAAGIDLTESMSVLTDLRRYLPRDAVTFANMSIVARIPAPQGQTVEELGHCLQKELASTYPATRALGWAALWGMRRRVESAPASCSDTNGQVNLTLSDVTRLAGMKKIGYRAGATNRVFAVALPPGDHSQVSACFTRIGHQLHLTATYHPEVVSRAQLEKTLESVFSLNTLKYPS